MSSRILQGTVTHLKEAQKKMEGGEKGKRVELLISGHHAVIFDIFMRKSISGKFQNVNAMN